jgi:hypothetical protein
VGQGRLGLSLAMGWRLCADAIIQLFRRVAQAFNFADIADTVGAPSLRCSQGRVLRTPAPRSYAARSRNEIFVHPSFTRTGPASSRR